MEGFFKGIYGDVFLKNLGAGGTASQFGLFRLRRDLADFKPDIIFIEFAVNDRIYTSYNSSIYFEGLIRECLKITDKVIIIDLPTGMSDSCKNIHKKIAYYYNLQLIDVQDKVWQSIGEGNLRWEDVSIDNLHPNNRGHELYFEIIKDNLNLKSFKSKVVSNSLMGYEFKNPRIVLYEELDFYGHWTEENFNLNNKFDNAATSNKIGDGIIFRFRGKYLAMMNLLSRNSGILECELDNFKFDIDLFRDSDGVYDNTINIGNLEDKEHTLLMKISNRKNVNSLGNNIVIAGFLVDF